MTLAHGLHVCVVFVCVHFMYMYMFMYAVGHYVINQPSSEFWK